MRRTIGEKNHALRSFRAPVRFIFGGRPRSLIQVLFLENRDNVARQVKWIWKLLNQLKTNYGIPHVNLVAHSMGCVSVLMYLNQYGYDERNSKVKRVVTMGAPFNDVEVGKRTPYIEDHPLTTTGPVEMSPALPVDEGQ